MFVRSADDLGYVLRRRRLELGITQTELADRAGSTRQWVSRLERGRGDVRFSLLLAVIDALDLNFDLAKPYVLRERTGPTMLSDEVLDALHAQACEYEGRRRHVQAEEGGTAV